MTSAQRKLLIKLLDLASSEFSFYSCNDFDLMKDAGLDVNETREILDELYAKGYTDELEHQTVMPDCLLMDYLSSMLKEGVS